jgi:hypothetical protein
MKSKSKVGKYPNNHYIVDDIFVEYVENDAIFDLTNQIDKDLMEATEGPDAADTCACCNKQATKMKNWYVYLT